MVAYLGGGSHPTDSQQLRLVASHADVAFAQPKRMARYATALRALNPQIALAVYENGMFSTPSDPSNLPESWFLHDAAGQRVRSARNPQNSLMNPLSTQPFTVAAVTFHGWADYVAHECVRDQLPQTKGCYLDMLGISPLRAAYDAGNNPPVDPSSGKPFSPPRFEQNELRVASAVRAALPSGSLVLANGYLNGSAYARATHALNGHVDAAQAQGWLGSNATSLPVGSWKRDVQMVISSGRSGSAMMLRYTCNCTGTNVDSQRTYALATYLLANTGHALFDFQFGRTKEFQDWSPLYNLNLGTPMTTYPTVDDYLRNGVYQRTYSAGLVLVNPGSTTHTVPVTGYRTVTGQPVEQVTLPPTSATILTRGA